MNAKLSNNTLTFNSIRVELYRRYAEEYCNYATSVPYLFLNNKVLVLSTNLLKKIRATHFRSRFLEKKLTLLIQKIL